MVNGRNDRSLIVRIQSQGALVSAVSVWEMAIKNGLGKMPLPRNHIAQDIEDQGFQWLVITPCHTQAVLELGDFHKDPFDRLLIAQAQYESLTIVTYDVVFQAYRNEVLLLRK